ncbi:MAG: glycosyltransferase family 4 protein, partial [Candidatus Cloacimonetes bacterium]|nr:glycosyltransferase family 4 protein [Candidatus Cloacimonadota bacterium]
LTSSVDSENEIKHWNDAIIHQHKMSKFIYKTSVGALKFSFYFLYWKKLLTKIFQQYKFDAIHLHDLPLSKIADKFADKFQIPFILDLHENWPAALEIAVHTNTFLGKMLSSNKQWENYEKKYTKRADAVITVVEEMKNRICKLEIEENKISVLQNTIELENFIINANKKDDDKINIFYSGGINYHRGLQIAIDAIKIIKEEYPEIRLQIVGSGSYEKILRQKVMTENLSNNVEFYGWKNYSEMMMMLQKAQIAIITHLRSIQTNNSSPNKLFQYMFSQKPIVVSDCDSVKRIVKKVGCGVVYKDKDSGDLAKKIKLLLKNDKLCQKMGNYGKVAVETKYNWQNSSKKLIEMYQRVFEK